MACSSNHALLRGISQDTAVYSVVHLCHKNTHRPFDPLKQATFFFVIIHSIPHNALGCISMSIALREIFKAYACITSTLALVVLATGGLKDHGGVLTACMYTPMARRDLGPHQHAWPIPVSS